jgi:hypothetical protein
LEEDADDGILKDTRGCSFSRGWFEESFIESASDMGEDYEE